MSHYHKIYAPLRLRLQELSVSTQTTYQTVVMNSPVVAKPEKECRVKDGEYFN